MDQQQHESVSPPLLLRRKTTGGIDKERNGSRNEKNKAVTRSMVGAQMDKSICGSTISASSASSDFEHRDIISPLPKLRGSDMSTISSGSRERHLDKTTISQEFLKASSQVPKAVNPRLQELTINKLKYESVGLIGREKEVVILEECCHRALHDPNHELVLITGTSGVGKSRLTKIVEDRISSSSEGIFGKGKFNLESSAHPYSGLVDALNQLYGQAVLMADDDQVMKLKTELSSELGSDVTLLATLIPGLETLAPAELLARKRSSLMLELHNPDSEQAQWKNALKIFIRILCEHCARVIFILDDLQWADRSSLEVIEDLMSDAFNKESLMIIGTFRSDEVFGDHPLSTTLRNLERKQSKRRLDITEIEPQNLNVDDVHNIIMALLGMDDRKATRGLAEICFKRTLGNPNFVLQFITLVEEEGLISFNLGLLKWVWDDKVIEAMTMSTDNVVDLLQFRMKKLSSDMRLLLQYAACLGSSFDPFVLNLLWEKHGSSTSSASKTKELLEKLVESNFLESHEAQYRWVHDKVQEAALEMEEAQKPSFQFEVGSTLLNSLPDDKLEVLLFIVTNLINKSNVRGHVEFAALNLRAAEKAQRLSAFYNGASYAAKAIELMPNDKFDEHREMILQAYTVAAEMEVFTGNVDIALAYCATIIQRDDYTPLEKHRLYMVKLNILVTVTLEFKEAVNFSLSILKEFGFKLPPKLLFLLTFNKAKKLAKKTTVEEYQNLKPSSDARLHAIMAVLGRMHLAVYHLSDVPLMLTTTSTMVNLTLEHGLFSNSGTAIGILGAVCVTLNDVPSATFFSEMGVLMQRSIPSKHYTAGLNYTAYHMILPWSQPFGSSRAQLRHGYLEGIRTGNISEGIWCLISDTLLMPLQMGTSLKSIDANTHTLVRVVEDLKQNDHLMVMKIYRQAILDLTGEDASTITGNRSVASDGASQADAKPSLLERATKSIASYFSLVYLGEYEEAAELSMTMGGVTRKHLKVETVGVLESFLRGVALFAMARKTKKRKYRTAAGKILKSITQLTKLGNPNFRTYLTLLSAEQAALKKDQRQTEKLYQESIVYAARTGHMGHAALSNERYADYLLHELDDPREAKYRMDEAIRYYQDWGAQVKVDLLQGSTDFSIDATSV